MANLTCVYEIRNTIFTLTKFRENLTEKSDIVKSKIRILNDLRKLELAYAEYIDLCFYRTAANTYITQVTDMIDIIKDMEDIESFKSILTGLENLETPEELDISDLKHRIRDSYTNSDSATMLIPHVVYTMASKIKGNRELKIFDPRCKTGNNMKQIKRGCPNIYSFGLEESLSTASQTKETIDRCIKGRLAGSKISNDVFDILFYVPEISWNCDFSSMGTLLERKEKSAIRNTIKFLRPDGLFMYTIPYYRLSKEIAYMLSKLLSDVSLVKHTDNQADIPYVTIIGYKDVTKDARQDIYTELSTFVYDDIPTVNNLKNYTVDGPAKEVQFFRGSILDNDELTAIYQGSGLYDSFWDKQDCSSNLEDTRPLLPFNMGQIGLVLTSGCLDGIIEEFDGQYHAIKGMVTKVKKSTKENNDNNTEQTAKDVFTNIVQINIFGPDGEFIELA